MVQPQRLLLVFALKGCRPHAFIMMVVATCKCLNLLCFSGKSVACNGASHMFTVTTAIAYLFSPRCQRAVAQYINAGYANVKARLARPYELRAAVIICHTKHEHSMPQGCHLQECHDPPPAVSICNIGSQFVIENTV